MEKNVLGKGQYATTGIMFIRGEFKPGETRLALSEQGKEAILKCLTESDEFHKLVCDITGVERKQKKVSPELEKLKEEYSRMCESYENEKQQRNDLLRKNGREETVKRMKMQTASGEYCSHHNNMMDRIKDLLKEVDMPSVKHAIEALKDQRANGKLLAEECELLKEENKRLINEVEKLKGRLNRAAKNYGELIKTISDKAMKSI